MAIRNIWYTNCFFWFKNISLGFATELNHSSRIASLSSQRNSLGKHCRLEHFNQRRLGFSGQILVLEFKLFSTQFDWRKLCCQACAIYELCISVACYCSLREIYSLLESWIDHSRKIWTSRLFNVSLKFTNYCHWMLPRWRRLFDWFNRRKNGGKIYWS